MMKFLRKNNIKNNIFRSLLKSFFSGIFIIVLGTVGIDAVDNYDNLSESIAGRLIFGKSKMPCPKGMALVRSEGGGFCVDVYEASAGDGCPFIEPDGALKSRSNLDDPDCLPVSRPEAIPWTNISQNQAVRACAKAGKRLPSNREWSLAALGTPDKDSSWEADDCQIKNNWPEQPGRTGSGKNCVSYAGAYDMIGNVWEWVNGAVTKGAYAGRELPDEGFVYGINENDAFPSDTRDAPSKEYYQDYFWIKPSGTRSIMRGGYWGNEKNAGQYAHYIVSSPTFTGEGAGFRCVKDPDR